MCVCVCVCVFMCMFVCLHVCECHSVTMASHFPPPQGTIMDVQNEKTLSTESSENAGSVLECILSASNYKQRFHTLIDCEMATHEEFLKRCALTEKLTKLCTYIGTFMCS